MQYQWIAHIAVLALFLAAAILAFVQGISMWLCALVFASGVVLVITPHRIRKSKHQAMGFPALEYPAESVLQLLRRNGEMRGNDIATELWLARPIVEQALRELRRNNKIDSCPPNTTGDLLGILWRPTTVPTVVAP